MTIHRGTWTHRALVAATGVAIALVLLWMSGLAPFRVNQLTNVFIYAIAITGLNLATGYTGLLSIGHSAFFGLGAYTTGVLVMRYDWEVPDEDGNGSTEGLFPPTADGGLGTHGTEDRA